MDSNEIMYYSVVRPLMGAKLYAFVTRSSARPLEEWERLTRAEREAWCEDAEQIASSSRDPWRWKTDLPDPTLVRRVAEPPCTS